MITKERDSISSYQLEDYSLEKSSTIVLDFGLKTCKIGYSNDSNPRHIVFTPSIFNYESFMDDDSKKHLEYRESDLSDFNIRMRFENENTNIISFLKTDQEIKLEIENFIHNMLYNLLHIQKKKKDKYYIVLICIDMALLKLESVYRTLLVTLLEYSAVQSVKFVPKQITPIYASGFTSGIVIDIGYNNTTITPVFEGYHLLKCASTLSFGGVILERLAKRFIVEDTNFNKEGKPKIKNMDVFLKGLTKYLGDIVVRAGLIVNKKLSLLMKDPNEQESLKSEYSKIDIYSDIQDFQISFLSRASLGERFFGDFEEEKDNIAYSLLKVIQKLPCEARKICSQNIILSGGGSMILGCYKRMIEEVNYILDTCKDEFEDIIPVKEHIKFHKILFPKSCLTWIGANFLANIEKIELKKYTITKEDYDENDGVLKKVLNYFGN